MKLTTALLALCSALVLSIVSAQQQCGKDVGGRLCPNVQCCSIWGYCGTTEPWCGDDNCQSLCWKNERRDHRCGSALGNPACGRNRCCSVHGYCGDGPQYCNYPNCQNRCWTPSLATAMLPRNLTATAVSHVVNEALFNKMFSHQMDCPSQGFYTYHAFLTAAESFRGFGTTGDVSTRKREIAAFLALVSQATSGKPSGVEDTYEWGLCHINSTVSETDFCTSAEWPCASGQKYSPRGAIQLAHNFNYGLAGQALGLDLIKNPELVATDPIVSFKIALLLWMSELDDKPSCHDIVVRADSEATGTRLNGVIGNIIRVASGLGGVARSVSSSVGYYKRYCDMLGVSYGHGLNNWIGVTPSNIQMLVA